MVVMSLPVAWLSVGGCWAYFSADWQRALTLGLYSRWDKLPRWLGGAAGLLGRWVAAWRGRDALQLQQRRRCDCQLQSGWLPHHCFPVGGPAVCSNSPQDGLGAGGWQQAYTQCMAHLYLLCELSVEACTSQWLADACEQPSAAVTVPV